METLPETSVDDVITKTLSPDLDDLEDELFKTTVKPEILEETLFETTMLPATIVTSTNKSAVVTTTIIPEIVPNITDVTTESTTAKKVDEISSGEKSGGERCVGRKGCWGEKFLGEKSVLAFHSVVVFGVGLDFLLESISTYCDFLLLLPSLGKRVL